MIRTLGGTDQEFEQVTNILVKVYEEVIKPLDNFYINFIINFFYLQHSIESA